MNAWTFVKHKTSDWTSNIWTFVEHQTFVRTGALSSLRFPARLSDERHVGSSFQFQLLGRDYEGLESFKRFSNAFQYISTFEKALWREGCEGGLVWGERCGRVHKLPPPLELCRTEGEASHWSPINLVRFCPEKKLCIFVFLLSLFDIPLYHTMSWKEDDMERVADIIVEEVLKSTGLPNWTLQQKRYIFCTLMPPC